MSILNSSSAADYVSDYECLIEGVAYFLQLHELVSKEKNTEPIRQHYEEHPEDGLCHLYRPGTRDIVLCRRSGIDAIDRMATRLIAEASNGFDLSRKRIAEIISENILQLAIDGATDDEQLIGALKDYVAQSEREHVEAQHYFPCVLFHRGPSNPDFAPPPPDQLALGPVSFQDFHVFAREFRQALDARQKSADEKSLEMFSKSAEKYGWVATVKIPRCAPDVSRRRAEEIVNAAINILKVFIGLRYGKTMRLPHTAPSRYRQTCVLTEVDNNVKWTWHGASLEGALVAGNPIERIPPSFRGFASDLLNKSLVGSRNAATNRLLDALKWFGDASFEESPGTQIVKWIAALERLTATERLFKGVTHSFCKRVALLASGLGSGNVENAYRAARQAYGLRSDVMHGSRSQDDEHLLMNVAFVHELTRDAIMGALALHHFLSAKGDGRVEIIGRYYESLEVPHEMLFKRLGQEFSNRAKVKSAAP